MNIQHILAPTDFSTASAAALTEAVALAKRFAAKVSVVHVIEPIYMGRDFGLCWEEFEKSRREQSEAKLQEARQSIPEEYRADTAILHGTDWHEIVRWAEDHHCDLIVLSTHGYSGLRHLWLGSVAERVVQHAHCPVFVVRGKATP